MRRRQGEAPVKKSRSQTWRRFRRVMVNSCSRRYSADDEHIVLRPSRPSVARALSVAVAFVAVVIIAGCSGVDRNSAKALGAAGVSASQALDDQASAAQKTLTELPEWWGVHDALVCSNVVAGPARTACLNGVRDEVRKPQPNTPLTKAQQDLVNVMKKRAAAAAALRDAYQSFEDLATYDAAAETEKSIQTAFGSINQLSKVAASIAPQGVVLPAISSTFTTVVSGIGAVIAERRQEELLLSASQDLHTACDAMVKALTVEADRAASESLLSTLRDEQDQLFSAFVQSGLIAPRDALGPLLSEISPGMQLVRNPPAANTDVIITAAAISLAERSRRQQAAVVASYDAALAALKALSAQHAKLEAKQPVDLSTVLSQAKEIGTILSSVRSSGGS